MAGLALAEPGMPFRWAWGLSSALVRRRWETVPVNPLRGDARRKAVIAEPSGAAVFVEPPRKDIVP